MPMKVHRYSEHERRLWVHQMAHKTKSIKAICAEAEISRATLYNWQNELAGMDRLAKEEQAQSTASLGWRPNDKYKMLLSALLKTDSDKTVSRKLAKELVKRYNLTVAQACSLVQMPEETYNHRPRKPEADDKEVYAALVHLLEEKKNRSLEDCIATLQQTHPQWAIRQMKRVYRQGRLYLKRTRVRRMPLAPETALPAEENKPLRLYREGAFWHFGCVQPSTENEEKNWLLYVLDYNDGTPLNFASGKEVLTEEDVLQLARKCAVENGLPKKIRIPAVAPFASRDLQKWCWEHRVASYNLSMAKPENRLEAEYINDDIAKQLSVTEHIILDVLAAQADNWIRSFAQSSREAVNYFAKETMV